MKTLQRALIAILTLSGVLLVFPAGAADGAYEATLKDVEQTFGSVPTFISKMPKVALPGAWSELKGLLLSDTTALPPKTKALIAVAVAAQIACKACLWMDTNEARRTGATDEEIGEAIAIAAVEQHWSTIIDGHQITLETVKQELGGAESEVEPK
jgi:AhpD family alkylhydroperoxidase